MGNCKNCADDFDISDVFDLIYANQYIMFYLGLLSV